MTSDERPMRAAGHPYTARTDDRSRGRSCGRRRQFIATVAGAVTVGLAGCAGLTDQSFAATPVRLPTGVHEALAMTELFTDAQTVTSERTVAGQDVSVTITNQYAGYGRPAMGPRTAWDAARPTLVDRFVGNGSEATPGSGSAINVVASDLGVEAATPDFVEGDARVPGDRLTYVVPERARHDGPVRLADLVVIHHADALGVDELTSRGGTNHLVPLQQVLPGTSFVGPAWGASAPDERWVAGHEGHWLPDDPSTLQCVVCLGEFSPADVFGIDELPGRRLEPGESVGTDRTLVFAPAPKEDPGPAFPLDPARVFDGGYPTPRGGPTYGLGVLATPNAELLGTSVNPLADRTGRELLVDPTARRMLAEAGLTDADTVEWLRGPERIGEAGTPEDLTDLLGTLVPVAWLRGPGRRQLAWTPADQTTLLGESVAVEPYGGVVSGIHGPWAVGVHLARLAADDVVVAAAVHRRPAGTTDGRELSDIGTDDGTGDGTGDDAGLLDRRWTRRALEHTGEVVPNLEARPPDT